MRARDIRLTIQGWFLPLLFIVLEKYSVKKKYAVSLMGNAKSSFRCSVGNFVFTLD